jgi:hypothetical protein
MNQTFINELETLREIFAVVVDLIDEAIEEYEGEAVETSDALAELLKQQLLQKKLDEALAETQGPSLDDLVAAAFAPSLDALVDAAFAQPAPSLDDLVSAAFGGVTVEAPVVEAVSLDDIIASQVLEESLRAQLANQAEDFSDWEDEEDYDDEDYYDEDYDDEDEVDSLESILLRQVNQLSLQSQLNELLADIAPAPAAEIDLVASFREQLGLNDEADSGFTDASNIVDFISQQFDENEVRVEIDGNRINLLVLEPTASEEEILTEAVNNALTQELLSQLLTSNLRKQLEVAGV